LESYEGVAAREKAADQANLGAGFSPEVSEKVEKLVLVASSFTDPGDDWTRWDGYDAAGVKIASRTVPGY
jgi:hypothetical protein